MAFTECGDTSVFDPTPDELEAFIKAVSQHKFILSKYVIKPTKKD